MIIQGPMGIVADRATGTKEAVWIAVENGSTAAISKSMLCCWQDLSLDNTSVSGILQNTKGLRVTIAPAGLALFTCAGFAQKDIALTTAGTRGAIALLQTYGWRDEVFVDTAGADNDTIIGGLLIPSTDTAGKVQGCSNNAAPTGAEVANAVGSASSVVATNATSTVGAFIKIR